MALCPTKTNLRKNYKHQHTAIFSSRDFYAFVKKRVLSPTMAPVNKESGKRKHKSLSILEKVELLKKLDKGVSVRSV